MFALPMVRDDPHSALQDLIKACKREFQDSPVRAIPRWYSHKAIRTALDISV